MGWYLGILPIVGWRYTLGISVGKTINNPRNASDKFRQCFFVFVQSYPILPCLVTACSLVSFLQYPHCLLHTHGIITNHSLHNESTKVANSVIPTKGNIPPRCLTAHHPTTYDTIQYRTLHDNTSQYHATHYIIMQYATIQ